MNGENIVKTILMVVGFFLAACLAVFAVKLLITILSVIVPLAFLAGIGYGVYRGIKFLLANKGDA